MSETIQRWHRIRQEWVTVTVVDEYPPNTQGSLLDGVRSHLTYDPEHGTVLELMTKRAKHEATLRPGIVGPGEPGHRVFESNFVMECSCGRKGGYATTSEAIARRWMAEHVRSGR